jgi:hypothetical protein
MIGMRSTKQLRQQAPKGVRSMSPFWSKFEGPAKWLVIFATLLLIAGGLCGLQSGVMGTMRGGSGAFANSTAFATIYIGMAILEVIVMLVSVVGILVSAIVWGVQNARGTRSGGDGETVKTGPESADKKDDTREQ